MTDTTTTQTTGTDNRFQVRLFTLEDPDTGLPHLVRWAFASEARMGGEGLYIPLTREGAADFGPVLFVEGNIGLAELERRLCAADEQWCKTCHDMGWSLD